MDARARDGEWVVEADPPVPDFTDAEDAYLSSPHRLLGLLLLVRDDANYETKCMACGQQLGQGYYVLREHTVRTLLERAIEQAKAWASEKVQRELTRESEELGLYEDPIGRP